MTILKFVQDLKAILNESENKTENLAIVAFELSSFYEFIEKSDFKKSFPKEIYDELNELPNSKGYTENTKSIKLSILEKKLVDILNSIENNSEYDLDKTNINSKVKISEPRQIDETKIDEFETKFKIKDFFEATVKGKGKYAIRASVFVVILFLFSYFLYFFFLTKTKNNDSSQPDCKESISIVKDKFYFLLNTFTKTSDSLNKILSGIKAQKNDSMQIGYKKQVQESKRNIVSKIDSIKAVIMPDLDEMSKKCDDTLTLRKIIIYNNKLQIYQNEK